MKKAFPKIIICVVLFIAIVLVCLLGLISVDNVRLNASKVLKVGSYNNIYSLGFSEWELENNNVTFLNGPSFSVIDDFLVSGDKACEYTLNCTSDTQYSISGSIYSNYVHLAENEYDISLQYFTRQRLSTPNVLTVYYLSEGNWIKVGDINCVNNGNDLDVWTGDLSLSFTGCPERFRFDYKVYYTQPDIMAHGGLYLNLNSIELISSANTDFYETTFSLSIGSNEFVYTGSKIYPEFEISTESTEPYYYTFEAVDSGNNAIDPINVGAYTLKVNIYNEANELCKTLSAPYSIVKEELSLGDNTIIAGQNYAVILDMEFIGVESRKVFSIQDLHLSRIYESADSITVTISGNPNFKDKAFNIDIPVQSIPYGLYLENVNVETVYNGEEQGISSAVTVFTAYDSGSGTFTTTSASLDVTYSQDGVEVQAPQDVGVYDYVLTYGTSEIEGTFTIKPKILTSATYVGSANLNKVYDGTVRVSYNSIIRNKLADSDIELAGIIGTDDVSLDYDSVSYAMNYGSTYLVIDNPFLTGDSAGNYIVGEDFSFTGANASISQATLEFNNVIDLDGESMTFAEKVYDNTNTCEISNTTNACLNFIGLGAGIVTYKDVSPTLLDTKAGIQNVNLELTNASLYDIYNPSIIMSVYPQCLISKYEITITGVTCSETDKQYDGTTDIDLIIDSISFSNPGFGDNLNNVLNYSIAYQSAAFNNAMVGTNKTIAITGITITAFNASDQSILDNYSFSDVETTGDINAEEIIVYTEYLRIIKGADVPEIKTSINNPDIIDIGIYTSELDAQSATNPVGDTNTVGEYFIRVTCSSDNYTLGGLDGYVIVPLSIVNLNEKADQHITINNASHDIGMLVNGWFGIDASSYSEVDSVDVKTGLQLAFSSKDTSIATVDATGKIVARAAGHTIITIKQSGNEYYNAAADVQINLNIYNYSVNVDTTGLIDTQYIGDDLPDLNGVASVTINSVTISGEFESPDAILISGENVYKYTFTPTSGAYSGTYEVDISLTAVKKTITVLISDTKNLTYGETLDYVSSITGFRINGVDVTYSSLISNFSNSLFKIYQISTDEDIEITGLLDVGTYVFYADKNEPGAEYYIAIDTEINGCVVELEGQIDVQVNQSVITVSISQLSKYYLEDMPTDFSRYLVLSGSYNEDDIEEILGYIDVTTGVTQETEVGEYTATLAIKDGAVVNPKYSFSFVNGYISVVPVKLSITANSRGHVYGNDVGVVALYINVTDSRLFTAEQLTYIKDSVTASTTTFVDVSSASPAGDYNVVIEYLGDNINFDVSIIESKYQVHKANLPERDFSFNDVSVLYDGLSHTIEVAYDETKWTGITIAYDKTSFIEIGTYVFTAIISKENYEDLRISASLTIGVNSISNNSETVGKAEINITGNTHILDTNYSLRIEKIEDTTNVQSLINETGINGDFVINIAYNLNVFYNLNAVELGESKYSIKLTPVGLTYSKDLLLYGYDENGNYGEIDYEYSSGTYSFVVSRLSNIAFITEVPETMNNYVVWIIVAIFGALIILVILISLSNGKRSIKSRRRSRRSHARWG